MRCEDAPCCGCCGPHGDNSSEDQQEARESYEEAHRDDDTGCYDDDGDNMTDVEADADTLASAGWGTNEDYGDFGEHDGGMFEDGGEF